MLFLPRPGIAAILSVGLFFTLVWAGGVSGVSYSTQLQPGDSVLYKVSGTYSENVTTTEMVVLSVVGTNLTASFRDRFLDLEPDRVDVFWIDLATGQRNSSDLIFAIGSGLSPGDSIPDSPSSSITIQSENPRGCGEAIRTVLYATHQVQASIGTRTLQMYWDENTGVTCDFSFSDPGGNLSLVMLSTSLWSPDLPPSPGSDGLSAVVPWLLPSILALVLLLLVISRVRRGRMRERA